MKFGSVTSHVTSDLPAPTRAAEHGAAQHARLEAEIPRIEGSFVVRRVLIEQVGRAEQRRVEVIHRQHLRRIERTRHLRRRIPVPTGDPSGCTAMFCVKMIRW